MGKFAEAANKFLPVQERLSMLTPIQREEAWVKLSSEDKARLWAAVPCNERINYLPPSESRVRSRCHADILYKQTLVFQPPTGPSVVLGYYARCSECIKAASGLRLSREQVKLAGLEHIKMFEWTRLFELIKNSATEAGKRAIGMNMGGELCPVDMQ